jgi:nitrate/nitrite transporter NarK
VGSVLSAARTWQLGLIYFCLVAGLYGVGFWLPTLIKGTGIASPLHIGVLSALPYACAVAGMIAIAHSADRRGERRRHLAVPAALGALGLVVTTAWSHDSAVALAALSVATLGILSALPLFWSLPTGYLSGFGAAAGIGLINSIGNLAGFASPFLVGWLKDQTQMLGAGILVLASLLFLASVLTLRLPRDPATRPEGRSHLTSAAHRPL